MFVILLLQGWMTIPMLKTPQARYPGELGEARPCGSSLGVLPQLAPTLSHPQLIKGHIPSVNFTV